ncbi:g9772 [Coccomyxa viridis]|uniref:G9772 protein n=1 Tax=Coccomyxa viridis TaxID=1274662 RepID=A0ABP1G8M7_9CHLO
MRGSAAGSFTHTLLPSLPTDRQLLVGGDFNCVAGQLDVLGPDNSVLGRTTGYYDGLRIAETDRQLFDIWPEGTTHLVLPAKPGWPHPVPSPLRYACALHPWEASGRLPGRTECDHAPDQWTPRLSQHPSTAGRSSSITM